MKAEQGALEEKFKSLQVWPRKNHRATHSVRLILQEQEEATRAQLKDEETSSQEKVSA
jgi:hypothetical protein